MYPSVLVPYSGGVVVECLAYSTSGLGFHLGVHHYDLGDR